MERCVIEDHNGKEQQCEQKNMNQRKPEYLCKTRGRINQNSVCNV